jgi:hypothetical protein
LREFVGDFIVLLRAGNQSASSEGEPFKQSFLDGHGVRPL